MSTQTLVAQRRGSQVLARAVDYLELTKPKIAILELVTVAVAAVLAGPQPVLLLHALWGTLLVAGSASALNQVLERQSDARMERTRNRPLADGRLNVAEVVVVASLAGMLGIVWLAVAVNLTTALLGLASWLLYVAVYTPLKSRSPANTTVGAVAGAIPVLMGWAAMGAPLDMRAGTLFLIVFLWQFPHFMAIAWIYRRQYVAAGMQMLPVVDPSGVRAGAQAVVAALALVPVSLVPALLPLAGSIHVYFVGALLLGLAQSACAVAFLLKLDDHAARRLLRASLVYLPALLLLLVLATPG
jgi:protoheme IX farnesyltransferase